MAGPGRAGITLLGKIVEADGASTAAQLSLSAPEPVEFPSTLNDLTVSALSAHDILLRSGTREWRVRCNTWQLHRDVGARFYAAIPPRKTPWSRRLTWRVLLGIAGTTPGRWLLARRARAR